MPTRQDLVLFQQNNETLALAVVAEDTDLPQDLTGKTLNLLIKPTQVTPDTDPSVITLSSGGSSPAIIITSATGGLATATVPAADLPLYAFAWWKLMVVEDSKCAIYGTFTIQAL